MVTWITVGIFPQRVPTKLNHHTTISLLIQRFSLNVVVLGKSADILYLFSEPKLLIINPSCTQSLILPPMSSKITSMCRSVTFHPAVTLQLTAVNQPQNRICDHFCKKQPSTTRWSVSLLYIDTAVLLAVFFFRLHWPTVLLSGAWRLLVVLTLLVLEDELRGLLLRILFTRRLQVFLYWCRSRE